MKHLANLTALVTGASRGIGPHIAEALAREKMHLVLSARTLSRLEDVAARLRQHGSNVAVVPADLTRREHLESLARRAREATGAVDVLVNNAGMGCMLPYHRIHPDDIEREVNLNLTAPLLLTRLLLPGMLAAGRGHVVNISSLGGAVPLPYEEAYCATKAGLTLFTKSLRAEYRPEGVSASAILPGLIRGAGMVSDFEAKSNFKMARSAAGCTPAGVARAVVRAIKRDLPEVIVNRPPVRPLLVALSLFPKLTEALMRGVGAYKTSAAAAMANLQSNGQGTGLTPTPEPGAEGDRASTPR